MTEDDGRRPDRGSFWHRRVPGIRYISSAAAIIAGAGLLVMFAVAPEVTWRLWGGISLLVVGVVSIPVSAWMEKRGI